MIDTRVRFVVFLSLIYCGQFFFGEASLDAQIARAPSSVKQDLARYVNPIYGTGKDGNTFPGPSLPFGMIQWSPDTGPGKVVAGYNYRNVAIQGFSLDHLSGAGCYYGGNFSFMPMPASGKLSIPKDNDTYAVAFSHAREVARPGYYAVTMENNIAVELTSTLRSGFGRFVFPAGGSATMMVNASSNVWGTDHASIHIDPSNRSISGSAVGGRFCRTTEESAIYFYAVFDHPFSSYAAWVNDEIEEKRTDGVGLTAGAFLTFDTGTDAAVMVKAAISYISVANAKANLEAENPVSKFSSKDFDDMAQRAGETWNEWLNKIQITGGTDAELTRFYTMMYHALLGPTVCSDANGQYAGYDGRIHTTDSGRVQYGNISGWDIYRSECQFLAMMAPKEACDIAHALYMDYLQGGAFPRWGLQTMDSGVMMGDPAAPIIAGFYAFGARDFAAKDVFAGLFRAATDPSVKAARSNTNERDALDDYRKLGYVPQHQKGGYGNVSMTLEYASADFALAEFARALGDGAAAATLLKQAQNWKNHFNPETGFLQMRRRDGTWAPGVADSLAVYDNDRAYVEGTAEQYVWMVPFNIKGLAELMGGQEAAAHRLDRFFTKLNDGFKSKYAYVGNEPCSQTPWMYSFLGQPYKTQGLVRRIMTELFANGPEAYPGNDDLGQMSSWYIFSALGMYPELPGSDVLVLGSPLFPKAVVHLKGGDITIDGDGAKNDAPYVHGVTVNGKAWTKPWIRFGDIANGGNIGFKLSALPNVHWGSGAHDAPPSYSTYQ
jgi:predicted alpha-1,2-mannosidase